MVVVGGPAKDLRLTVVATLRKSPVGAALTLMSAGVAVLCFSPSLGAAAGLGVILVLAGLPILASGIARPDERPDDRPGAQDGPGGDVVFQAFLRAAYRPLGMEPVCLILALPPARERPPSHSPHN
ncbi:MAG TPA: hypothetical protein VGG29_03020 [Caulobacteraceae bacterium]|jgi:hypothetical protein